MTVIATETITHIAMAPPAIILYVDSVFLGSTYSNSAGTLFFGFVGVLDSGL